MSAAVKKTTVPRLTTSKKSTGFRIVFCMYLSKAVMSKIRDAKFLYGYFSARSLKLKHVIFTENNTDGTL